MPLAIFFRRTAARYPDKTALVAGEITQTFAEVNASVNRLCAALVDRGMSKGDRLGILSQTAASTRWWRSRPRSWA